MKLGLPVPDGFWSCIFPGRSSISIGGKPRYGPKDIALLSEELRPAPRTRPVRLFGVCAESQKAGLRYVWEVRYYGEREGIRSLHPERERGERGGVEEQR